MAYRNEPISSMGINLFNFKTGSDVDSGAGGGVNGGVTNGSYSIIVMDSKAKIGDFYALRFLVTIQVLFDKLFTSLR